MMKSVLAFALMVAVASAAFPLPRQYPTRPPVYPSPATYDTVRQAVFIPIVRQSSDIAPDGSSYQYSYETGNGISAEETGQLVPAGPEPALAATGSFQYTSPEGVPVQISYVADENGFQPSGNVLPTPPPTQPIPPYILRALEYNAAHPEPETTGAPFRKYYK